MARQTKKPQTPPAKMTFEEAIEELESMIEQIEQGEVGLEEALAARKRGDALIRRCRSVLDHAEQEIRKLSAGGDGDGDGDG